MANTQLSIYTLTDLVHQRAGNFDGMLPDGAISTSSNRIEWAAGAHAGLIDLPYHGVIAPIRVLRMQLYMAGQATWSISIVDGLNSQVIASGTTEVGYTSEALSFLTDNQKLRVTTTGGGTTSVKMVCTVADARAVSPAPRGV